MEIRVLGPIEVIASGERLDLGGPKQRTVLAVLVANAGRRVSTDHLINAAYGDDAPDAVRRSIQTYVSNLRSLLGDMITSVKSGYEFTPVDSWVDAEQFVTQLDAAKALIAEDPKAASTRLSEALALWRGHPFHDIEAHGELDAETTRLSELRLVALETRIDADLELGLDRELVGELEALTAEHPYREAFQSQQMLALYRAGRQAEALRSYTRIREHLAEDLGIDPSPALRQLEQRILDHDPTLALAPKSAVQRRAILVVDLAAGIGDSLGTPDERRRTLIELDRVVENAIADAGGDVAAQRATATYGTFDDVRSAIEAANRITTDSPRIDDAALVRLGVDVGDVEEEPSGMVSGPAVIRAAGLVAAANPGQVLLSSDAQATAAADTFGGWAMRALGQHTIARLKEPETVHQLLVDGQPSQFPPLLSGVEPPELPMGRVGVPGYEMREEIGHGVFGTVYRAYQPSVGREVAVKVINPELANDPAFIRRFAVEAQMIARIEHPNVVPLHDFWRGPDGALLVMRLMRGGNLADYAGAAGLDRDGVLRLVDQVGGALATAHSLGIAHGDVQASNVLLNESGDFFLGDFGVASTSTRPTERLAQELDTAAFAATIERAAALLAVTDAESSLLESARHGAFDGAGEMLLAWRAEIGAAEASPTFTPTRNPYKGLAAFNELDAKDFHGRAAVIDELVAAVATKRLVAAVGPSGVGKSSAVRAGLLPELRSGAVEGSAAWLIADCTPGSHPFERLATAVVRVASSMPHDLEDVLRADDRGLVKAVDRFLPPDAQLLLIVDQFEELFTLTGDSTERDQFLDLLTSAVQDTSGKIRILATIRADFFDRPLRHPGFGELLRAGTVPISAPTDAELRDMVANPAAGVGVTFESGLVERIIAEVHGEAGALPLVEFSLTELFEQRDSDLVTLTSYENSQGVIAALGRRAEGVFANLDDQHQDAARQLFLRLVTPGVDGSDTRRRVRRTELDRMDVEGETLDHILTAFGKPRLLTFDHDEVTRGATVEVAHEALIREWPRLKGWIDANREELVLRGRLAAAVADWEQAGRSEAHLLAGGRLAQHESWTETTELSLSSAERDLLNESRTAEDERAARRKRVRQLVLSGFAAAAIIALVLSAFALSARRDADDRRLAAEQAETAADESAALAQQERDRATSNAALAEESAAAADRLRQAADGRALLAAIPNVVEDDPQLALLLSIAAAERLGDVPAATSALHDSIAAETTLYQVPATSGDMSPDGSLLAVIGEDATVEVHDIASGSVLWTHEFELETLDQHELHVEFANDGTELVATVAWLPTLAFASNPPPDEIGFHVWDAATGELKRRFDGGNCGPLGSHITQYGYAGEVSDAFLLAGWITDSWFAEKGCAGWDSNPIVNIYRVDATTGEQALVFEEWDSAWWGLEMAMSADGKLAALGIFMDPDVASPIVADGQIKNDGQIKLIDIETGEVAQRIELPDATAGVGLSPDGSVAVSYAGQDSEFRMYDVASGTPLYDIPYSGAAPWGWWFSEDGSLFSAQYDDGFVRLYRTTDGTLIDTLTPIDATPTFHRISRDNQRAVVFGSGMARVSALSSSGGEEVAGFDPCGPQDDLPFYLSRGLAVHGEIITLMVACDEDADEDGPSRALYTYSRETGELLSTQNAWGQRFAATADNVAAVQTWRQETDGSYVVGELTIVDLQTGDHIETLPDLCGWDGFAFLTVPAIECVTLSDVGLENTDLVISADGNLVAVGSFEWLGDSFVWNRTTGAFDRLGLDHQTLAISPDGSRIAGAQPVDRENRLEGALLLYSADGLDLIAEQPTVEDPFSRAGIDFSPDGDTIVGVTENGLVRFHDAVTLEETRSFAPHEIGARDIDFDSDGSRMATVGRDGFARVWDLRTLTLLHEIEVGGLGSAVAFAEDDSQLVVMTRHEGVRIFELELDSILDVAQERLLRGLTEDECRVYFPDGTCPTTEEMMAG